MTKSSTGTHVYHFFELTKYSLDYFQEGMIVEVMIIPYPGFVKQSVTHRESKLAGGQRIRVTCYEVEIRTELDMFVLEPPAYFRNKEFLSGMHLACFQGCGWMVCSS